MTKNEQIANVIMRTPDQFKEKAKANNIHFWPFHDCGICSYKCGYILGNELVQYDNGCYCTNFHHVRNSSWEDLAAAFNCQTNEKVIKEMNEFWGFDCE